MGSYKKTAFALGGEVFLYILISSKKPIWYYRFSSPFKKGYHIRSSKSTDLGLAQKRAIDDYNETNAKFSMGASVGITTIQKVWDLYRNVVPHSTRSQVVDMYRLYWKEYFGEKDLYKYRTSDWNAYLKWRSNYLVDIKKNNPELYNSQYRRKKFQTTKIPHDSIRKEKSYLIRFLRLAHADGLILRLPMTSIDLKSLKNVSYLPMNVRRGRLDYENEYQKLVMPSMRSISKAISMKKDDRHFTLTCRNENGEDIKEHVNGVSWRVMFNHASVWAFLLTIANSGIRSQELSKVKWTDVELWDDETTGESFTIIHIRKDVSKVRKYRDVVCRDRKDTYNRLMKYKALCIEFFGDDYDPDGFIFVNPRNTKICDNQVHRVQRFHQRLGIHKVERIHEGESVYVYNTATSYRSLFITLRLLAGINIYSLSRLVGTSPNMIAKVYDVSINKQYRSELTRNYTKHDGDLISTSEDK